VCPSAKGITTPSAARLSRPLRGYVAKLGLVCSPSVMIGELVCSKRASVSRRAASSTASNCSRGIFPIECACIAASKSAGRGILPIGSVGISIGQTISNYEIASCRKNFESNRPPSRNLMSHRFAEPGHSSAEFIEQQYYKNTTDIVRLSVYLLLSWNPRCLAGRRWTERQKGGSTRLHPKDVAETLHALVCREK
jgi:hypothetical protein